MPRASTVWAKSTTVRAKCELTFFVSIENNGESIFSKFDKGKDDKKEYKYILLCKLLSLHFPKCDKVARCSSWSAAKAHLRTQRQQCNGKRTANQLIALNAELLKNSSRVFLGTLGRHFFL